MTRLSGSLNSGELPYLLMFFSRLHQTGCLQLRENGWTATINFSEGSIVAAAFGNKRGGAAIVELTRVMHDALFAYTAGADTLRAEPDVALDRVGDQAGPPPAGLRATSDSIPPGAAGGAVSEADATLAPHRGLVPVAGCESSGEVIDDLTLASGLPSIGQVPNPDARGDE